MIIPIITVVAIMVAFAAVSALLLLMNQEYLPSGLPLPWQKLPRVTYYLVKNIGLEHAIVRPIKNSPELLFVNMPPNHDFEEGQCFERTLDSRGNSRLVHMAADLTMVADMSL